MDQTTQPLDLAQCDREPIHIPGSIQPHGILLAVDPDTQIIQQVAGDTVRFLTRASTDLLEQPVDTVLGAEAGASLLSLKADMAEPLYLGSLSLPGVRDKPLDLTAHICNGVLFLELEPSSEHLITAAQRVGEIRRVLTVWSAATNLQALLKSASEEFRRLTGFDRVMIYRFLEDETGLVASEDKIDSLDALLNHHYPASDIPRQARALYLRNPIRVIADVGYTPAPLIPMLNPVTGQPLDMSGCSLRSVSPIHVQYLKNLNVAASMSVSIVVNGQLWGLVSCHHTSPRQVSYEMRETCKLLGQTLGQLIKAHVETAISNQAQQLAHAREELLKRLAGVSAVEESIQRYLTDVQHLVQADGAALLLHGKLTLLGSTPSEEQARALIEWLLEASVPPTFATRSLVDHYEPAKAYAAQASGLLAVVISHSPPFVLLWFRAEYLETINWAGNPHKPAEPGALPGQLTPRKSFEDWKETVRYQARPWSEAEIDSARKFGRAVLELRMQNVLQGLNGQLQKMLADKESLLARKDSLTREAQEHIQALHKRETELSAILENTSDGYICTDEAGTVTAWNRKAEEIFLWSREEAIGALIEDLIIPAAMREAYREDLKSFLATGESNNVGSIVEHSALRKDGMLIPVEIRVTAVQIDSRTIFSAFVQDITPRKLQEKARLRDAQEDALTGLANRRVMYRFLKARLEAKPTTEDPLWLLYLDLDGFKPINDTLGHAAGDQMLVEVSHRLKQCMREDDLVSRIGGDEFVIVANGLPNRACIDKLCERLLKSLRKPVSINKHEVSVGCSIGIVSAPDDSSQADDLLRFADIALYEAKAAGRNTWQFYTSRMSSRLLVRRQIETDLRLALRRDELRLEFQPRYEVRGGRLMGAEALVRWQHPLRGYLNPDSFISIAEETGLIVPLSDWVLRKACLEATQWKDSAFVSVNLSPIEFKRSDLVARVQAALEETGLAPERLELEVTESVMLDNTNDALAIMKALKALGVRLSMDDFGTGYSSLSYIHTYPFDGIKIDRSFISVLDGTSSGEAIIEAIIGLGRALSLTITAEGVETQEQLELLARLNCHQAQGFYLGRPMQGDLLMIH
jgi:diguanylate cyclase (GGDEF)-like protein/PAS domain S-box-containing protein